MATLTKPPLTKALLTKVLFAKDWGDRPSGLEPSHQRIEVWRNLLVHSVGEALKSIEVERIQPDQHWYAIAYGLANESPKTAAGRFTLAELVDHKQIGRWTIGRLHGCYRPFERVVIHPAAIGTGPQRLRDQQIRAIWQDVYGHPGLVGSSLNAAHDPMPGSDQLVRQCWKKPIGVPLSWEHCVRELSHRDVLWRGMDSLFVAECFESVLACLCDECDACGVCGFHGQGCGCGDCDEDWALCDGGFLHQLHRHA